MVVYWEFPLKLTGLKRSCELQWKHRQKFFLKEFVCRIGRKDHVKRVGRIKCRIFYFWVTETVRWISSLILFSCYQLKYILLIGILEVNLERPGTKNAIGKDMLRGLQHTFETVHKDHSAKVLMICSSVPKVFCAGADLKVECSFNCWSCSSIRNFIRYDEKKMSRKRKYNSKNVN